MATPEANAPESSPPIDPVASAFPPIGSLAALGDGRSLALLGPDGNVEWFCPGRFDAPPLVWPLLDRQQGGCLRIAPLAAERARAGYLEETAVFRYEWQGANGGARASLCMEWPGPPDRQCLLWLVEGLSGGIEFEVAFVPRPDFGRASCPVSGSADALELEAGGRRLWFQSACALRGNGREWTGRLSVHAGERAVFCLGTCLAGSLPARPLSASSIVARIEATTAAWRAWSASLQWSGRYRQDVVRSAITLKLLIHEPTGAVVAAGSTSLPEAIGGERNWDYRYTWFRDAGMTLSALFRLGCRQEAHRWAEWMQQTMLRHGMPLQVLYDVEGGFAREEENIPGISGYRGSRPVRVGNAARNQFQLDIYGELLECVHICDSMADDAMQAHWLHLRSAADFIAAHWREPGQGIWEMRSAPRHYVHSKAMAWVGLQRALWLQRRHDLAGDGERWSRESERIRREVMRLGISRDGRHFVQAYGEERLDASLLLLARNGFVEGNSELFGNTVSRIRQSLGADARGTFVRRYQTGTDDGLASGEGAFVICSFWLVEALVQNGQLEEAEALFERLLELRGEHGLYAEEIDPHSGEQLGNVPQAFSHVGLINAALALRDGVHWNRFAV
ncbi:glycoside hydrolase family 15 protein [Azotobacter salinestris]|uniref:glycoside hydrolase family 15 protein n=1 Tax=Azotobacter salinestris TaxID=69964 RepID=UPI00142EBF69|nr:glycoside hydrolase family 15 protein [Azotobacter salinestris]